MTIDGKIVIKNKIIDEYINRNTTIYIQNSLSPLTYKYNVPVKIQIEKIDCSSNIYSIKLSSSSNSESLFTYSLGYFDKSTNKISLNSEILVNVKLGETVINEVAGIKGEILLRKNYDDAIISFDGNFKISNVRYYITSKDKYINEYKKC
jgi:hypothetical protein